MDANNYNTLIIDALKEKLKSIGYNAKMHPEYLGLIVNDFLEIYLGTVNNPNKNSGIIQVNTVTIQPKLFPKGISENVVGAGVTEDDRIQMVINNYLDIIFYTVSDSLTGGETKEGIVTKEGGQEINWYVYLGYLIFQGHWEKQHEHQPLFELLKQHLKSKLTSNSINWLKVYAAKMEDGSIIAECFLNNELWEEGLAIIKKYAISLELVGNFMSIKQFMMFRKCHDSDTQHTNH